MDKSSSAKLRLFGNQLSLFILVFGFVGNTAIFAQTPHAWSGFADSGIIRGNRIVTGAHQVEFSQHRQSQPARTASLRPVSTHQPWPTSPSADDILAAQKSFFDVTQADVDRSHQKLEQAYLALDRYLGQDENGQKWRKYLRWELLRKWAVGGAKTDFNLEDIDFDLYEVLERFQSAKEGLEQPPAARVRQRLREYIQVRKDARNRELKTSFEKQLQGLAAALRNYNRVQDAKSRDALYTHTGWLLIHGQALPQAYRVRRRFDRPNLYLDASEGVLHEFGKQDVDETAPVRECILDSLVLGTGRTIGEIKVLLNENPHQGSFVLRMDADSHANTVAHRDPVKLYGTGYTRLQGDVEVFVDSQGFLHPAPAQAHACSDSDTHCIDSRYEGLLDHIAVSIAWKRSERQGGEANQEASQKAANRLAQRLDRDVARRLRESNQNYENQLRGPLLRRDIFPTNLSFQTTPDHLRVVVSQPKSFQLGAPNSPPPVMGTPDLNVRIHESYINNVAFMMFADRKLKDTDARKQLTQMLSASAAEAGAAGKARNQPQAENRQNEADGENGQDEEEDFIEIVFDDHRPVTASIENNVISLTVRGLEFIAPSRTLLGRRRITSYPPMNVTVRYRSQFTPQGVKFTLDGSPEALPPDAEGRTLSGSETAIRTVLIQRLEKELRKEFTLDVVKMTGQMQRLGDMKVTHWTADKGWISFGLTRISGSASSGPNGAPYKVANHRQGQAIESVSSW